MFTNLTTSLSILQHVNFPTHINGYISDLVFSSSLHSELMSNISRLDLLYRGISKSHSNLTLLSLLIRKHVLHTDPLRILRIKNINYMIFLAELLSALGDYCYYPVVLNSILSHLLDKHAPSKIISVTQLPDTPWFTSNLLSLKLSIRKSERI